VTYNGVPIYQYSLDTAAGQTHGLNLFDPFTTPQGVWYLLSPGRGLPDTGAANLSNEMVTVTATGHSASVLAGLLDQGSGNQVFPVYTFSTDAGDQSTCQGQCAVNWPPVLTDGRAQASDGANSALIGNIVRPDGSHQVTYAGHPLYFFIKDATLPHAPGVAHGSGITAFGGTFNLIPPQ
jgi:predicted lipoprotein with Yx(FWY)xxD motif